MFGFGLIPVKSCARLSNKYTIHYCILTGITAITTFAICCDRIFFASGDTVYVQNLEGEPRIRKTLYQATGTISKIDVCCNNDK